MKKTLGLIFLTLGLLGCSNTSNNKIILDEFKREIPGDNFYFIDGLHKDRSLFSNVKYRGLIYSDKLEKANYRGAIEISLLSLNPNKLNMSMIKRTYENALLYNEAVEPVRKKIREIFGPDVFITNNIKSWRIDWHLKAMRGETPGVKAPETTYVDVFVPDVTKINEEEYKRKAMELYSYLYEKLNVASDLYIFIRNENLLNYNNISSYIYRPFLKKPEIKALLEKYKATGKLSPEEMGYLMNLSVVRYQDFYSPAIWLILSEEEYKSKKPDYRKMYFDQLTNKGE